MKGGELYMHIKIEKKFSEQRAKFYAACLVMALGALHSKSFIYRDLKLENCLIDDQGYCKLTDFGLAKLLNSEEKTQTFCGTPEYLAPEIILGYGHDRKADWWSLGIITYEMICGIPPFYTTNTQLMYKRIVKEELLFKTNVKISDEGKDFISRLLTKDPLRRIGSETDSLEIMSHKWFSDINFSDLGV